MRITGLMTIATMTFMAAGSVYAEGASVSRCNFQEGSTHKPGLWITKDGVTSLVKVGEDGLTRRIIFDDQLAVAYARARMGAAGGGGSVGITSVCSKDSYSPASADEVDVVAVVIDAPTDCGPVLCGPTGCGPTTCGPTDCGPTDCGPITLE